MSINVENKEIFPYIEVMLCRPVPEPTNQGQFIGSLLTVFRTRSPEYTQFPFQQNVEKRNVNQVTANLQK